MNKTKLLELISYIGFPLALIGLGLTIISVFLFNNNTAGINFRYGFYIPVKAGIYVQENQSPNDTSSLELKVAKPFTLVIVGCPSGSADIDSIRKQKDQPLLTAQNRLSMMDTELKVKSGNLFINIWLLLYNILPYIFWGLLFYFVLKIFRAKMSPQLSKKSFPQGLSRIGWLITSYQLILLLMSLSFLLLFGGAAYISSSEHLNQLYHIHFHPRIILNWTGILVGISFLCIAELIRNEK